MTIVGIAGCTGLMLTGFGIRDSVMDIPTVQFEDIFKYEITVAISKIDHISKLEEYLNSNENIENYSKTYTSTGKIKQNDNNYDITMIVPEDSDTFNNICNMTNAETKEELKLSNNGIIITDKIAEMLNVEPGDEVTFIDSEDVEYKVKIDTITRNYVSHYIYMSKDYFEKNIKNYKTNMIYINTKDVSEQVQDNISKEMLDIDNVVSVTVMPTLIKSVSDMLNTMNYVVVVLIVSSALLAFVVLYNLASVNISERQREIATLKVLGFYNKEVDNYINKENIIFTIVGVILGLGFGVILTNSIIASIEIDMLKFMRHINPLSYVYSAVITILFSLTVNMIIHFILKKIDMIESLKSVE